MIIDFRTHLFPDALAERAQKKLLDSIDNLYTPAHDMKKSSLVSCMEKWGIDISVVQPVITKASQLTGTNEWAKSICDEHIISFGGIYPKSETWKADIDYVVSLGLKGLKFHPEYQNYVVDSPEMLPVYDYALSKGLILLFHAGFDPAYPPPFKSSPQQFRNITRAMKGGHIIAAHLGGHAQWDDVEKYLVGENIFLDTSMGSRYYPREQILRIIKDHGAEKILFASDSPWSNTKEEIDFFRELPISEEERELIFSGNAKRILGL